MLGSHDLLTRIMSAPVVQSPGHHDYACAAALRIAQVCCLSGLYVETKLCISFCHHHSLQEKSLFQSADIPKLDNHSAMSGFAILPNDAGIGDGWRGIAQ